MILVSKITIEQMTSKTYPSGRNKTFVMDFVNSVETKSSWKLLTDTAKVIMPKNVYVATDHGNVAWTDVDVYTNTTIPPIFLRGDKITVELGYEYQDRQGEWVTETNVEFKGFLTKINPKIPIEIDCEDNMWLLKQMQCPNMVFSQNKNTATFKDFKGVSRTITSFDGKDWNTTSIIKALLNNAIVGDDNPYLTSVIIPLAKGFKVVDGTGASATISTTLGEFRTQNETIGQVLNRLRNDFKLDCFFRTDNVTGAVTLYVSGIVYYPDQYLQGNQIISTAYDFEQNVVENSMLYSRTDDVRLGIKAYSVNKLEIAGFNSAGKPKTKQKRLETFVGDPDGDIRTQYFWDVPTVAQLKELAIQRLNKLKYEGWKGTFSSFGLPYVKHGDAVSFKSDITPERNGTYLTKSVSVKFDHSGGFRRIMEPHLRIYNDNDPKHLNYKDFINGL